MAQFHINRVLIQLFVSFNLLKQILSASFCLEQGQNIQRTSSTLPLTYTQPSGAQDYDNMFFIAKDVNTSLKATTDLFTSLTIQSCTITKVDLDGDMVPFANGSIPWSISGTTIEMNPWEKTKGTQYKGIVIEIAFSTTVTTKIPKYYQVDHEIKLGGTFFDKPTLKCQHQVFIAPSKPFALKMAITSPSVQVQSQNPISFKFTPMLDSTTDEFLILISRSSYARDFIDIFSIWSVSTFSLTPSTGITLRNNGTDYSPDPSYFCLSLILNTPIVFKSGTEYELKINNFIYPFHPLGIQDAQIRLRYTKSEAERNSLINSPSAQITSTQFTPKTGTPPIIRVQYCIQTDCSLTGNIGAQYNKIIITIANPSLLIINTQLDVIFSMDQFKFDSADQKAVSIKFSLSDQIYAGTFTYNQPTSNLMKASFIIPSIQYISNNNVQIEITKPIMGLDSNVNYNLLFNSISKANINGIDVSAQQFQMTYTSFALTANTFKTIQIDDSVPLQIGSSQEYKFKLTPLYVFTTSQMWIKISFPTPSYSLDQANTNCYKVTLNKEQIQISSSSIQEITRSAGVIRFKATFSASTQVTDFTVSTCNIKNPLVTGTSGNIKVEVNYNSEPNLSESGITTVNIQPAKFSDGTTIQPLDASKNLTMDQNGYIFTLKLPISQAAGNKLKIWFPDYLTNFLFDTSSQTYSSQNFNRVSPNIFWEGVLQNAATDTITVQFKGYNPPIAYSSYKFTVEMYDSGSNLQLNKIIDYTTNQYTPRNFRLKEVTRLLAENAAQTTYTFKLQLEYFLEKNFFFRIEIHNSQSVVNLNVVESSNNLNALTATLTQEGLQKYIDISSTLASTFKNRADLFSEFVFEVKSITNYRSTYPIQFKLFTGQSATTMGCSSTYSFNNNYPKSLSENSIAITSIKNKNFGEYSEYEFSFKLDIGIPEKGRFDIITPVDLPNEVTIFNSAAIFKSERIDARKIRVTCDVQECKIFNFSIRNLMNPTYDQFTSSNQSVIQSIKTYDNVVGTDYIMQQVELTSQYYKNDCYPSKPYKNFCKDCNNQLFCTSCYSNAIFGGQKYDKLDTVNNMCVQNCPSGTYESNLQCLKCTNNCKTCTDATTCLSCVENYFLQRSTCKSSCDNTFFANSIRECELCNQSKCKNCSGSADNCTSCQSGKGLITKNSFGQCVICNQSDGYYDKNDNSGICGVCNSACSKCSGTADKCSQCVDTLNGQLIYFNSILSKCTNDCELDGYSKLLSGNKYSCGKCAQNTQPCKFCKDQPDFCTSCGDNLYLLDNKCVYKSEIPEGKYGDDTTRVALSCPDVCKSCVSKSICIDCISKYSLANNMCVSKCPDDTVSDGAGNCKETLVSNLQDDNRVVPFPMLLASIAFSISIYFSKYEYNLTFVPGCVVGFCSLFEWISWIILIAAASQQPEGMNSAAAAIALLGFLLLYIINIVQFILIKKIIESDAPFMEWLQSNEKNKLCYQVIKYSSLIISFKAQRVIFSKYFNQSFFKAKLNNIDLFSVFNKLALVSVFISSSLIIIASALVTYTYAQQSQGFFLGLDSLIVTILMIMFMIWDSLKKKDFFEEPVNQFDQTFSQRFFPFDQSYIERIQNRALESHRLHRGESNSSLADFRENKKITNHEALQSPLSQVLDPNEITPNANIDKNVLKNSEYGAPYLICDQMSESYKPGYKGGKRNFDKRHVAPIFDYSRYNPIQEEDEEFDEENMDLKYRQSQSINQSGFLKQSEKFENSKNYRGKNNAKRGYFGENGEYYEEEPVPHKPNTGHTVYYNDAINTQSIQGQNSLRNSRLPQHEVGVSIGVNMNEEEEEENKQLREKIFSKPNIGIDGLVDLQKSQTMRQSYSPKTQKENLQNSKLTKTEGNVRSSKSKKSSSPTRSISISPKVAQSTKKQKSNIMDNDDPNMRNSQISQRSNKSKKSNKNGTKGNDDNMSFYFAHPVENERGDSAAPINHLQQIQQQQQKKNNSNKIKQVNDENRVEKIMPNEEDIENSNQKTVQPKYDLVNKMKMKGPYNSDRDKVRGLLGLDDEQESPQRKQQNKNKGKRNNVNDSQQLDKNIYDSEDSVRTAEEAEMNYNEVSPSDFNVLNQRYEEDFFAIQLQQQMQQQQQLQRQTLDGQVQGQHPESSIKQYSMQMGSVVQGSNTQVLGPQQLQILGGSFNQQSYTRPPLALANSHSNVSVGHAKSTKSVGVKKKSNKVKPHGEPKNYPNQVVKSNHQVQHQGLMTPTSGSANGARNNQRDFNNQEFGGDYYRGNPSPLGSQRQREGDYSNRNGNNRQEKSDGFYRSNTQNMLTNSNLRTGTNHQATRMGSISPSRSNQVITYKVPQSDINKLKNLEKIYLQRLEISSNNQSSAKKKKTKNYTQNITNENYDQDTHSVRSSNMNNFNGYYGGETRQARDTSDVHAPSLLDNRNSLIIADFGDDASYKE